MARDSWPSSASTAVGDRPEADRRRPALARRRARGERARPRADDAAASSPTWRRFTLVGRRRRASCTAAATRTPSCSASRSAATGCSASSTRSTLRLAPRRKLERVVEVRDARRARRRPSTSGSPTASSTATSSSRSTRRPTTSCSRGVFSCYRPVDDATPIPEGQQALSQRRLGASCCCLTHTDKARGVRALRGALPRRRSGQLYRSDAHQFARLRGRLPRAARRGHGRAAPGDRDDHARSTCRATGSPDFMDAVADDFRADRRRRHLRHGPPDRARRGQLPRRGRASRGPA